MKRFAVPQNNDEERIREALRGESSEFVEKIVSLYGRSTDMDRNVLLKFIVEGGIAAIDRAVAKFNQRKDSQ